VLTPLRDVSVVASLAVGALRLDAATGAEA